MSAHRRSEDHPRNPNPRTWGIQQSSNSGEVPQGFSQNQGFMPEAPAVQSRGRGRRRGRGGFRPRNVEPVQDRPEPVVSGGVPPPKHLSKTSSEIKNDPLYLEAFFPSPSDELREISKESSIYPGLEGLVPLVKQSYEQLSARSPHFRKNISESVYAYYVNLAAYARLLFLTKENLDHVTYDERQFLEQYLSGKFTLPKSIERYLAGLGNTQLPSGAKQWFRIHKPRLTPSEAGIAGYFGSILENPGSYASYPSPGVAAQRILEDLRFTREHGGDEIWDLPEAFCDDGHPLNPNAIGYQPATRLTREQIQFIELKGVDQGEFGSVNEAIPMNVQILNGVSTYLAEIRGAKLVEFPTNVEGSQAQLITARVSSVRVDLGRSLLKVFAPLRIVGPIAYLGGTFTYKFRKTDLSTQERRLLLPTTYAMGAVIPPDYVVSFERNSIGLDPKLDQYDYESTEFNPTLRLKSITALDLTE